MARKITVDIVSDTVCPWCYVGKRRFEEALARRPPDLDVYVGWRPFQLNPDMPAEGMDRKAYLAAKFGGDERAEHIYSAIVEAGASTGLDFDFAGMARQPNTLDSHRLIDRAGRAAEDSAGRPGLQDAVVERLFRACFMEGRDIGDRETLVELAADAGMDADETRAYLASDEDAERIRQEDLMARQMGIQGVPCFIVNRQYAVSGAQEPAVFLKAFEQVLEAEDAAVASAEPAPALNGAAGNLRRLPAHMPVYPPPPRAWIFRAVGLPPCQTRRLPGPRPAGPRKSGQRGSNAPPVPPLGSRSRPGASSSSMYQPFCGGRRISAASQPASIALPPVSRWRAAFSRASSVRF